MATCLIALGANLGDRRQSLQQAVKKIEAHEKVASITVSSMLASEAVGGDSKQGEYLNAAALLETSLPPVRFLKLLQKVENELGRTRAQRWGPRTIDLDLLLYDDLVVQDPSLSVPHPRMAFRRFVLEPAAEIAPTMVHPTIGWTMEKLLNHLNSAAPYIAVATAPGTGESKIVKKAAAGLGAIVLPGAVKGQDLATFYSDREGVALDFEREQLENQARQFQQGLPEHVERISDFWFDQTIAFARTWRSPEVVSQIEQRWRELRPSVLAPKLLAVRKPAILRQTDAKDPSAGKHEQHAELHVAIRRQVAFSFEGPVLELDAGDPDWESRELQAAMLAMR